MIFHSNPYEWIIPNKGPTFKSIILNALDTVIVESQLATAKTAVRSGLDALPAWSTFTI
jgi:hypothetical protein